MHTQMRYTHVTPQQILSVKYISNRWSSSARTSLNERVRGIIIGVEDRAPVALNLAAWLVGSLADDGEAVTRRGDS